MRRTAVSASRRLKNSADNTAHFGSAGRRLPSVNLNRKGLRLHRQKSRQRAFGETKADTFASAPIIIRANCGNGDQAWL
jgi:hypothetical protein